MAGPRRNLRRADTREAGDTRARANTIDSCNIRAGGERSNICLCGACLIVGDACAFVSFTGRVVKRYRVSAARGRARGAKKAKRPSFGGAL